MDQQIALKHKGLGISSFVMSLIALILFFVSMVIVGVLRASNVDAHLAAGVIGLIMLLCFIISLVGIGLGIAGARDRESMKVFPVLGIVLGAVTVVIGVALLALGLVAQNRARVSSDISIIARYV